MQLGERVWLCWSWYPIIWIEILWNQWQESCIL